MQILMKFRKEKNIPIFDGLVVLDIQLLESLPSYGRKKQSYSELLQPLRRRRAGGRLECFLTQHPPPLIQHYHQPPHLIHSTLMYTIKYSNRPSGFFITEPSSLCRLLIHPRSSLMEPFNQKTGECDNIMADSNGLSTIIFFPKCIDSLFP